MVPTRPAGESCGLPGLPVVSVPQVGASPSGHPRELGRGPAQPHARRERPRAPLDRHPPTLPFEAPPEPLFYHIDSNMVFKEDGSGVLENKTPLLINRPGEWRLRPGDPRGYRVPQAAFSPSRVS